MKKTSFLAVLTAGALMLSGCNVKKDDVVAKIGDVNVTIGDMSALIDPYVAYGYDFATAKDGVAESMEMVLKMGAIAEKMNIEVTDEMKDNIIQGKAWYTQTAGGLTAYKAHLEDIGSSMDFIEKFATASVLSSEVQETVQAEVNAIEVKDEDLKAYHVDNYYRAKHILIPAEAPTEAPTEAVEETTAVAENATEAATETATEGAEEKVYGEKFANELLKRAKNGEDFDAMIEKYSTDPGSETNPDGYVFTDGAMVEAFEKCVKGLKPGEFGICKSDYGYHIIERLPLTQDEENYEDWFETDRENIESAYDAKLFEDRVNELCKEYKIDVKINKGVLKSFTEKQYTPIVSASSMNAR